MVYRGNRSRVGSAFPTRIGTGESARAGTGGSRYWDGDTGRAASESGSGEIIVGNGETCNSSSSKSVPGPSDETARTPGQLPAPDPNLWTPESPPPGKQADWTMQPRKLQMNVGGHSVLSRPAERMTTVVYYSSCQLLDILNLSDR